MRQSTALLMDLSNVIDEIHSLEHFRTFACSVCNTSIRYHTLQFYAVCPKCGGRHKSRSFGGVGTEIQDVIDAVLEWAGVGEDFEAVLNRHSEILSDRNT